MKAKNIWKNVQDQKFYGQKVIHSKTHTLNIPNLHLIMFEYRDKGANIGPMSHFNCSVILLSVLCV